MSSMTCDFASDSHTNYNYEGGFKTTDELEQGDRTQFTRVNWR